MAVGGQDVVGAAGVVAHAFRAVGTEEDGTGVLDSGQEGARVGGLHDEVFRRVGVADSDGLLQVGGEEGAAVGERCGSGIAAQLAGKCGVGAGDEFGAGADEDDLAVGAVFGLGKQVAGDVVRVGGIVGDDQHF